MALLRPASDTHVLPGTSPADDLAAALRSPACYPHPAGHLQILQTHISLVALAGEHAYKIKKPVVVGFLDFSTPQARLASCEAEVRLNARTAPALYLGVVPITGTPRAPRVAGAGVPFEHAVHMRRFDQRQLLDRLAREGRLKTGHVDSLARVLARFHEGAACATASGGFATPGIVLAEALDNFRDLIAAQKAPALREQLLALRDWTVRTHAALAPTFERRLREGRVREGHGDLHLGNIVLLGGEPVPFDCLEFDEGLRWIDVMSDGAFTVMDLVNHGLDALAARFLDRWLAENGDYDGLRVLPFYLVYRAMVRAKVASLRAHQGAPASVHAAAQADVGEHVTLAWRLAEPKPRALVLMHGLAGSGKSTLSQALVEALGAVRLRSDLERKRLHAIAANARTDSAPGEGIYSAAQSERTYGCLAALARGVLAAGWPVVVDASFLRRSHREAFREIAREAGVGFAIAHCEAPQALLEERLAARARRADEASEAGVAVLAWQRGQADELRADEREATVSFEATRGGIDRAGVQALARLARIAGMDRDQAAPRNAAPVARAVDPGQSGPRAGAENEDGFA